MAETVFKRKLYNEILEWKKNRSDKYALLIKGARRVGNQRLRKNLQKTSPTEKLMIFAFPEQYPIWLLYRNIVSLM